MSSPVMPEPGVRREEDTRGGDLLGRGGRTLEGGRVAEAAHQLLHADAQGLGLLRHHAVEPSPGDRAGADAVDGDAVRSELQGEAAHQADHAHLGGGVRRALGQRSFPGHRGERDEAAAATLDHPRDQPTESEVHAVEVDSEALPPLLVGELVQWPDRAGDAGIGHHHVGDAERGDERSAPWRRSTPVGHVAGHGRHSPPPRGSPPRRGPASSRSARRWPPPRPRRPSPARSPARCPGCPRSPPRRGPVSDPMTSLCGSRQGHARSAPRRAGRSSHPDT